MSPQHEIAVPLTDAVGNPIISTASYRLVFEDGGELGLFHNSRKPNFGVALHQHSCAGSVVRYLDEALEPPNRIPGALVPYSDEELPPPWKWLHIDVVGYHELLWTSIGTNATGFTGEQDGQFIRLKLYNGDGIRAIQNGNQIRFVKDTLGKDSIRVKFLPVPLEANYPGY
ncbi:hypothetical protein Clacol_001369 [Clathrus columnatus]|uniref:Uncharacterized protein n=1 Tax=Clathrus columnatus TaxID=1419009 RepID=A0AAV4ZY48_9AGAM|nr:hypothetical protein Clacol_001369 [Clathrus columnatus]